MLEYIEQQHNSQRATAEEFKSFLDIYSMLITDLIETTIRVQVPGLEGFIPPSTTLAQLTAALPHVFGPHLTMTLHLNTTGGTLTH